ncbi:unnamed protein product [Sphagnum balticum]
MGLTCKICFESATGQGAKARITSCGHVFCHPCSAIWFRSETACPVCRSPVPGSSALVALFDHDAGLQSPSLGLADDNNNDGGGGGSSGLISEEGQQLPQRESPKTMAGPGMENVGGAGAASNSGDNEDVQVKYVLGKVAERWQQVMVERARLKVQVARLEKTKQELLAQVQSLSIENTALKQGISMQCRPVMRPCPAEPQGDLEHDRRCAGYVPETGLQGFGRDTTAENPPCYLSNLSFSELGYGGSEPGYSSFRVPTRRPPPKVEERLGAPKWELAHSFSMHSGPVHGIAVNPSGNLVATASWDHLCRVYDVHLEEEVAVLAGHLLGLYAVKFSPAKRDLVGTVSSDQTCRLWSTETGACVRVLESHTDEVNGLSFKEGTHLLATASDDTTSMIWDAEKGISVTTLKGHRHGVYGVCFQPHGGHLVATASFDFTAKLWDPRSGEDVQTLRGHLEDVIGVDIDDSGMYLATGSDDKTCRVWDLRMGSSVAVLQVHAGEVKRVAFSPFGRLLATTSGDTMVRLFDTSTWECSHVLSSHNDHVFDVAWSPTADFLVTASHDRMWKLWQPRVLSLRNSCFMADNQQHYASSNLPADGMQMEHTVVV